MEKHQKFNFYNFLLFSSLYLILCLFFKTLISGIVLENFIFDFYFVKNTGAAFSLFDEANYFLAIFAGFVCICVFLYVFICSKKIKKMEVQAYAFLMSGICSNMLERFIYGGVIDYFRLKFIDFPIFNLADIFINIGVLFLIFLMLKRKQAISE